MNVNGIQIKDVVQHGLFIGMEEQEDVLLEIMMNVQAHGHIIILTVQSHMNVYHIVQHYM